MADSFDTFRYVSYMRSSWRLIAASCAIAAALALVVSLIQPREYTATARVVIEPPAGTDLRSAMAVSPIYLESLKTYEHFATGDSLFSKAIDRFDLRSLLGNKPIESLKKRVLKVETVRNTRVMEVAATLPDARKAQALARFLAESTVEMNRSMVTEGDQDLLQGIGQQAREIRAQLQETDARWVQLLANEPVDDLRAAMGEAAGLRSTIRQQILSVELEIADDADRAKLASPSELSQIRKEESNAHARLEEMGKQIQALDRQYAEREKLLAVRLAHRDKLDAERKSAQAALVGIETRLREARGDAGYRGERLKIVDPGIVPERPSSPNLPLNLAAAVLLGLVLPILYLTLEMSYQEQRASARRSAIREVATARDE
jgi:uncharacterized protein involved in exopolysaccharide biosynthesis